MIRAKVGHLGEAHLSRVAHQVADRAMEMGRRVVDILPVLDTDEVRYLGREEYAAVPASDCASTSLLGNERVVLRRSDALQALVGIALQPRYAVCLVQPRAESPAAHEERRPASQHTIWGLDKTRRDAAEVELARARHV